MADKPIQQMTQPELAAMKRENDELKARLNALEQRIVAATEPANTDIDPDRKAWLQLSAQKKSELAVEKEYGHERGKPGVSDWQVSVPGAKDQPVLNIPAHSEVEAVGRYAQLCGIRVNDREVPYEVKQVQSKVTAA